MQRDRISRHASPTPTGCSLLYFLFCMSNRTYCFLLVGRIWWRNRALGPCLMANDRILISVMWPPVVLRPAQPKRWRRCCCGRRPAPRGGAPGHGRTSWPAGLRWSRRPSTSSSALRWCTRRSGRWLPTRACWPPGAARCCCSRCVAEANGMPMGPIWHAEQDIGLLAAHHWVFGFYLACRTGHRVASCPSLGFRVLFGMHDRTSGR
jgi:hypothetical protein